MLCITHHASDSMRSSNLNMLPTLLVVSVFSFPTSFAHGVHDCGWRLFRSTEGFVVRYPGNWVRKGISKTRLTILSVPGGATAVVIKKGQAEVSVIMDQEYRGASLADLISAYTRHTHVLSRRRVLNTHPAIAGCKQFERIVSKEALVAEAAIPGASPYIVNTELFCGIGVRKYVIALRNFQGDKKQPIYQRIALRMAETLRSRP